MQTSGSSFDRPNLQGVGNLAVDMAGAEGFYGQNAGAAGAIRHAIGASYSTQGGGYRETLSEFRIPQFSYPEKARDEDLDLWYAKGGPNYNAIDANYKFGTFGKIDFTDFADTINNRVGVDKLSNLPFEERYEKAKEMTIEQLEHFIKTGGEFKKGLPVWNSEVERINKGNTVLDDGKIKNVEDAQLQLDRIKDMQENVIEQRRMGLLSNIPEASTMEQLEALNRNQEFTYKLNKRNEKRNEIKKFKEENKSLLNKTEPVKIKGQVVKNILTKQAKEAQNELEKLENRVETYERAMLRAKEVSPWLDKVMEEQNFLKTGNDWVLQPFVSPMQQ